MNRKLISKAISNIDDALIAEAMSPPAANATTPERTTMKHSRKIFRLCLAACLLFALAISAYASNFLGIRDMLRGTRNELPEEAYGYIHEHTETAQGEDWSARVTESLSDESQIMVTVTVLGGDKYIIAPTDADPDTLAVNIGIEGDLTLGEYAAQQGKELLFVGATLMEQGVPAGGHGSQHFEHTSPSEMTILVKADVWESGSDILCHVYAVDAQWNKQTLDLPITLEKAPVAGSAVYVPDDPDAISGITVGNATVTETPLGITIRFMETITDEEAFEAIKIEKFDGLTRGNGGLVLEDDGNWWLTVSGCTGTVTDTLTVRFYDWDDQELGAITFKKQ